MTKFILLGLTVAALSAPAFAGDPAAGRRSVPQTREGGRLVRDPHCGTHIPEARALRLGTGGNTMYFCSETCRERWTAAHSA